MCIDRQLVKSSIFFFLCGALSLIGLIHSVHLDGSMYLPWAVGEGAHHMWLIVVGYSVLGVFLLAMGIVGDSSEGDAA